MPWEKTFNEEKTVEAAMLLFWKKGYTDTSMADLLKATGLTKGSFYNAFGSKHDLFVKTLSKYDLENRRIILQELIAMDMPLKAIETFFEIVVKETIEDTNKKGCFIVNTSISLDAHEAEVQKIVTQGLGEVETFFKQMIELGQLRGEISKDISAQGAAKALMSTVIGIRVLGRGIYNEAALTTLSEHSLKLIH